MKALVTGASGFIGKHLVKRLEKEGYEVRCLVRKDNNEFKNVVIGNLLDKDSLKKAVEGIDIVFHLGAVIGSRGESKKEIWEANVDGTKNIIEESYSAGVKKFIHFSTFLVYGYTEKQANEETLYKAETTFYGESKRQSEIIVREYNRDKGMKTVIIQPTIIHGPGLNFGFASAFSAIQNGKFLLIGNGENLQHLGYIDNLIEGTILASKGEEAVGKTYIIGDEYLMTFKDLVEFIAKEVNVKIPEMVARMLVLPLRILASVTRTEPLLDQRRINFMVKNQAGDIGKIKRELGFKPKVSPKEGLRLTIEHYKKIGVLK